MGLAWLVRSSRQPVVARLPRRLDHGAQSLVSARAVYHRRRRYDRRERDGDRAAICHARTSPCRRHLPRGGSARYSSPRRLRFSQRPRWASSASCRSSASRCCRCSCWRGLGAASLRVSRPRGADHVRRVLVRSGVTGRKPGRSARRQDWCHDLRAVSLTRRRRDARIGHPAAWAPSAARVPDLISFAAGYPDPATFPWDAFREIAERVAGRPRSERPAIRRYARLPAAARRSTRASRARMAYARRSRSGIVTTGSQQALDLSGARAASTPVTWSWWSLPTYTGAISAFRNAQADAGRRAAGR